LSKAHDIDVPTEAFSKWLNFEDFLRTDDYHLLVTSDDERTAPPVELIGAYLESAYADARYYYHKICNLDLHPVPGTRTSAVQFPNSLPDNTRKGMFGEALCGIVVQTYLLLENDRDFDVPVFLFRQHSGVEEALTILKRGGTIKEVPGRHGDDFIGIEVDEEGWIIGFIVGEAKYRSKMNASVYDGLMNDQQSGSGKTGKKRKKVNRGILGKMVNEPDLPISMNSLKRILQDIDEDRFERLIVSIEELDIGIRKADRVDLVVLACAETAKKAKPPYSPTTSRPSDHKTTRPLVIAELVIPQGGDLITSLYDDLYR